MITGPDALTPSEARIVRMAADGMGNRDIAQALFLTVRTVENHLGSAYRKLGIGSRDELRGLSATGCPPCLEGYPSPHHLRARVAYRR